MYHSGGDRTFWWKKMMYAEYHLLKIKYMDAQKMFDSAVGEKERLFLKTQPQAINPEKEKVMSSTTRNSFDEYLIAKEEKEVDSKISEAKSILMEREHLLRLAEIDLRRSGHVYDKVYSMYFLDGIKPFIIAKREHYSVSQIYRILEKIKSTMRQNAKKSDI